MRVEDHPGVQGLSQLGRNAIDRVIELEQARARDNMAFKQLLSQRDALLKALRAAVADWDEEVSKGRWLDAARAAIAKAEEA